jgi:uncharacterized phage-associated protein
MLSGHKYDTVEAMIVTHEREKLIQAINFFVRNTRKCGKTKLFKLLYFLDFEHFQVSGRSVTGMTYNAWPLGPVPVSLNDEIAAPPPDLLEAFNIETREIKNGGSMLAITSKLPFSAVNFTPRERGILEALAKEYRDSDADSMGEATHLENLPWYKIYVEQGKKQAEIPYSLAVRKDETDLVMRVASERKELLERLK